MRAVAATDAETLQSLVETRPIPARLFPRALRLRTKRWRIQVCDPPHKTLGRQLEHLAAWPVTCRARGFEIRLARASLVVVAGSWVASASVER